MQHLQPNTTLQGGKYRIERVLGQGGFGITYLAVQTILNRKVAVKEFFMSEYCTRDYGNSHVSIPSIGSKEIVEKFKVKFIKEAQIIASLNNNNIIRIYDIFEENNTAYYVMEYHQRGSLNDLLEKQGKLSEDEALHYIRQIASALAHIHKRQMNHLDVKPMNILIDDAGNTVLIDFGLTKHYYGSGNQTSTTPVGISHGYAPLEQYKPDGVSAFSPQTDIYALGATLYKLITGVTPPQAIDILDTGSLPIPKYVSRTVAYIINKAMQPRKNDRPQSINDFLNLLNGLKIDNQLNISECTIIDNCSKSPRPQVEEQLLDTKKYSNNTRLSHSSSNTNKEEEKVIKKTNIWLFIYLALGGGPAFLFSLIGMCGFDPPIILLYISFPVLIIGGLLLVIISNYSFHKARRK